MCPRYSIFDVRHLMSLLSLRASNAFRATYNAAISQKHPVIRRVEGKLVMDDLRWGFDHPQLGTPVFNTRDDKIKTAMWRDSFLNRRCLVPANGFYDYDAQKQPYYFSLASGEPFCFAGLWKGDRFSFVTTEPNQIVALVHTRMPVILTNEEQYAAWLDQPATPLLRTLPDDMLVGHPVAKIKQGADGPQLIQPEVKQQRGLFE